MRKHWKATLSLLVLIGIAVGVTWATTVSANRDTKNAVSNELKGAGYTNVLTQDYAHGNGQYTIWANTTCKATTSGFVTIGTNYSACAGATVLSQMTAQTPGVVVCMSDGDPTKIMDIIAAKDPKNPDSDVYYDQMDSSIFDPSALNAMPNAIQLLHQNGDKTSNIALGTSSTITQVGVVAQGDLASLVANQCG